MRSNPCGIAHMGFNMRGLLRDGLSVRTNALNYSSRKAGRCSYAALAKRNSPNSVTNC